MYKNLFGTILGVVGLMGILAICPQITQAYNDGIYTGLVDENGIGVITVIFGGNDTFSGVEMTLKAENQSGNYYWGNNIAGNYTTYYGVQNNNRWGGSGDTYDNGFNPKPTNFEERQGPCDSGYHVPSRGERNALIIARCSIDAGCNARYDTSGGVAGDFKKASRWTSGNNLIRITTSGLGTRFEDMFTMSDGYFWSSSPSPGNGNHSWELYLYSYYVDPDDNGDRISAFRVRCLKNSIVAPAPQTFIIKFFDDGVEVASGSVVSGEVRSGTIPTPDEKDGYRFDYRYADGTDTEFDFTSPITGDVKLHAHQTFTAKIPNGIYTGLDDGDITVILNDDTWGSINLTLAGKDLEGKYYRGFNYPNTHVSGAWNSSTSTFGEEYNSIWGGGSDNESNGYSPNITNHNQRQGPCISGYHIPSRGELNVLVIAWCNLDESCNARYSNNTSGGIVGDLKKSSKWNDGNKLIYLSRLGLGSRFKNDFNIENSMFWSSSPQPNQNAWLLNVRDDSINADDYSYNRNQLYNIRCFKNYIAVPYIFTVNFLNGDEHVWSGDIVSGDKVPEEIISGYNLTGLTKEGYTFSGWIISGSDEMFDVENDIITTGMILNAVWSPRSDTPYLVQFYFENVEGDDYVLSGELTENLSGITDDEVRADMTKEFSGFSFSGNHSNNISTGNITGSGDLILKLYYDRNSYELSFVSDGNVIRSGNVKYEAVTFTPTNPTKNGYKFMGWDKEIPTIMPAEDMIINAKWERNGSSGGGGGGGGGGGSSSKTDTGSTSSGTGNQINSNTGDIASTGINVKEPETNTGSNAQTGSQQPLSPTDSSPDREQTVTPLIGGDGEARGGGTQTYTQEFQEAYEFAHENGITTKNTIQSADMNGKLTRIAMAKMLSQYAINVLGKTPDATLNNKFNDVTDKRDADYDNGVTLAYQLGIMGQNMPGNNFRPDDEVTRAEFATALSRMLYNISDGQYKSTDKYYTNHMSKLVKEGIITKDDPKMKELRGYVMIMLMRSTK